MKLFFSLLFIVSLALSAKAQVGRINGQVIDGKTAETIMAANILVSELGVGTTTDLDGNYFLELNEGVYTLKISYIGYQTIALQQIKVVKNESQTLDVQLQEEALGMDTEVIVEAEEIRNTDNGLVTIQKKSAHILDGVSANQIARTGDKTAASALQRVSGVAVQGGKYIYVRGLSDRYSKTTFNGLEVPALDPNRNSLQLDLISANLIDNILVYKTFSPELYGDFVGGYVDIETKGLPDGFMLNVGVSTSYNSVSTFNENTLHQKSYGLDWIAMGADARKLPENISQYNQNNFPQYQAGAQVDADNAQNLASVTRAFDNKNVWELNRKAAPMNHGFSLAIGNQHKLFKRQFGWVAALNYNRQYNSYQGGSYGIYELSGDYNSSTSLLTQLSLKDDYSSEEVLWGAIIGATYKLSNNHKLNFNLIHNQSGTTTTRYLVGRKQRDEAEDIFETRTWGYVQRGLTTAQLGGKHELTGLHNLMIKWQTSYAKSSQDEPDLRYFTNRYNPDADAYFIKPSSDRTPSRFYRNMTQANTSSKIDLALPISLSDNAQGKIKAGTYYGTSNRNFAENRYTFAANGVNYNGNINDYFAENNLVGVSTDEAGNNARNTDGIYAINDLDPANTYEAAQQVLAFYGMIDLNIGDKIRIITGLRAEQTKVQLKTLSSLALQRYPQLNGEDNLLDNMDLLPSFNIHYDFNPNLKLRGAYNRTLARPTFRELAPFASFDVEGGFLLAGNPNLKRTLADNFDLRLEFYPNKSDIISISTFYKHFKLPIERTYNPEQPNGEFTFRNVPTAFLAGIELESRKSLAFIDKPFLRDLSIIANVSYIYSETKIDETELSQIRANRPDAPATREMYGQAPYSINALLNYTNNALGFEANIIYNVVGSRLSYVTIGATPNIYEMPRNMLNINVRKTFAEKYSVRLSVNNLLGAQYVEKIQFKTNSYDVLRNPLGMTFGLSFNANF
jgi:TonB-dependent receptor